MYNTMMSDSGRGNRGYYAAYLLKKYQDEKEYPGVVDISGVYHEMSLRDGWYGQVGATASHTSLPSPRGVAVLENDTLHANVGFGKDSAILLVHI